MPTLIRLVITLLFLVGLAYGGMIALVAYVQPKPKEITIRIPSTALLKASAPTPPAPGSATIAPLAPPPAATTAPAAPAPGAAPIAPGADNDVPE